MSNYDEQREKRRYEADVSYEVWRSGGNPDRIDHDRVNQRYWDGQSTDAAASAVLRAQRPKRETCNACGCEIDEHGCGCNPHDA